MTNFFLKKDIFIKYIPFYMTIILSSISSTIYPPNGYAMTFSFVPLICILFWSLVLGRYFGPLQFFIIGIVTDLLMGTPIGSYLLLFTIIRYVSFKVREKFQITLFHENIIAATVLILVFYFLNSLFFFVYHSKFIASEHFFLNIVSTIFLYPAFAVFFTWLYKITSLEKYYVES